MGNKHNIQKPFQHFQDLHYTQQPQNPQSQERGCAHNLFTFKKLVIDSRFDRGNLILAK